MDFNIAIDRVLASEGGYVNNPLDPGGETNWGISKRSYRTVNIKSLTRDQAVAIYKRDFWDAASGDTLHPAIAFQSLDFAVNSGCDIARRYLQRAAGVADDGYIGPVTLAAITATPVGTFVLLYIALRLDYMTRLKGWPTFGAGWSRRIVDNMMYAAKDILS